MKQGIHVAKRCWATSYAISTFRYDPSLMIFTSFVRYSFDHVYLPAFLQKIRISSRDFEAMSFSF